MPNQTYIMIKAIADRSGTPCDACDQMVPTAEVDFNETPETATRYHLCAECLADLQMQLSAIVPDNKDQIITEQAQRIRDGISACVQWEQRFLTLQAQATDLRIGLDAAEHTLRKEREYILKCEKDFDGAIAEAARSNRAEARSNRAEIALRTESSEVKRYSEAIDRSAALCLDGLLYLSTAEGHAVDVKQARGVFISMLALLNASR
jgi:hypothetical protein